MTKPPYDQPLSPNDGQFYPIYPEFYDFSNPGSSTAAAGSGGGGVEQPGPGFSGMYQAEDGHPHGWDLGLGTAELAFVPPPEVVRGGQGHGLQPQPAWDCGAQAYPPMMGSAVVAASPMSQFVPAAEESMGGCYEQPSWPPPPVGQISPSPSQGSYYASSPARGVPEQSSRHSSCFQAVSPSEGQLTSPGGTIANNRLYLSTYDSSSPAGRTTEPRRNARNQTITATTTADHNAGTLSPAFTPSPKDSTAAVTSRSGPQAVRRAPEQQTPERASGAKRTLLPALRTAQQQPQTQARTQAHPQSPTRPRPPPQAPQSPPTVQDRNQKQKQKQKQKQQQQQEQTAPPAQQKQVRNREAANNCRAKSKLAVAELESAERAMSSEHRELSATARDLRDEVLLLKNELLAHGNCNDSLIQQYLTNQARVIGGVAAAAGAVPHDH